MSHLVSVSVIHYQIAIIFFSLERNYDELRAIPTLDGHVSGKPNTT